MKKKFHAMIELANDNSRFKDFYDTYKILTTQEINKNTLADAIKATFENRQTVFIDNHPLFSEEFVTTPNRLLRWNGFLRKIKSDNIDFSEVVKTITSTLHPVYNKLIDNKI